MSVSECVGWGAMLKLAPAPPTRSTLAMLARFDLPTKGEVKSVGVLHQRQCFQIAGISLRNGCAG